MRTLGLLFSMTLMLFASGPLVAQGWIEYRDLDWGFGANFPGEPVVEEITRQSEFGATLPGRVYRADTPRGDYSATVIDYRQIEQILTEQAADCPPGARPAPARRQAPALATGEPTCKGPWCMRLGSSCNGMRRRHISCGISWIS